MIRRKRIGPPALFNNRPPKNWDLGYELVVQFHYGLNEDQIRRIAGLRNNDSGCAIHTMQRDLMFPCGTNKALAYASANRLRGADHFGALSIKISHPVEHEGKNSFTPWYSPDGTLIERVKHRKLGIVKVLKGKSGSKLLVRKPVRTVRRRRKATA